MQYNPGRPRAGRTVTLADVARYAGVSTAVVSYVINDGPRPVAAATALRVKEAIAVLGYRPNSHARALRSGRTRILGLVHPGTSNPFFGEYIDTLYAAATRTGLALLTASSAGSAQTEHQLIEDLAARNVDGILAITSMTGADVPGLRHPGLPLTLLNCPFPVPGVRTLGPDGYEGARRLVGHLVSVHGHRDVALIAGETGAPEPDDRERGWLDSLRSHGLPARPALRAPFTLRGGYEAARTLITARRRPTAIFVELRPTGLRRAPRHSRGRHPNSGGRRRRQL